MALFSSTPIRYERNIVEHTEQKLFAPATEVGKFLSKLASVLLTQIPKARLPERWRRELSPCSEKPALVSEETTPDDEENLAPIF